MDIGLQLRVHMLKNEIQVLKTAKQIGMNKQFFSLFLKGRYLLDNRQRGLIVKHFNLDLEAFKKGRIKELE